VWWCQCIDPPSSVANDGLHGPLLPHPPIAAAEARPRNPFCSLPPVAAPSGGRMSVPAGSAPGTHHAHSEPDRG